MKCTEAALGPLSTKGIRLATFIDDFLLAASSAQEAIAHTEHTMAHLSSLGFRFNLKKSVLTPSQSITFIGLSLDSVTMSAQLTPDRVKAIHACLALFRRGNYVTLRDCHRLLGLMASALMAVPLGRLYMRGFQRWVSSLGLDPRVHAHRRICVPVDCTLALRQWKHPYFLTQGVQLGTICARKVVTTDASLWGWGATHEGRSVNGRWRSELRSVHINVLELMAVFLALRHFLPYVTGAHVLVRTENTTALAYINKQGGLRSPQLHRLAHKLILWSSANLLSLRATHVPGVMNHGADLLSRGPPSLLRVETSPGGDGTDSEPLRVPVSRPVCLQGEHTMSPVLLSERSRGSARVGRIGARVATHTPLHISPVGSDNPHIRQSEEQGSNCYSGSAELHRDLLSQARGKNFHPHPERLALWAWPVKG